MKHFYLIANPTKEGAVETAIQIRDYLILRGATCTGGVEEDPEKSGKKHRNGYTDPNDVPEETECVITLGGGGTLIQASRDLVARQLPLIGINLGNLGYLTQVSRGEDIRPMLEALLNDNYTLENRMMLEGRVTGKDGIRTGVALNDIVLARKNVLQMLKFRVFLNGEYLNEYLADGMIAATPTGSTAYNLSAGGPVVTPGTELIVLTPICPHTLGAQSIVLSSEDRIEIHLMEYRDKEQTAVFDGDQVVDLRPGDTLEIFRSRNHTVLIKLKNISFLETLRNKMDRV